MKSETWIYDTNHASVTNSPRSAISASAQREEFLRCLFGPSFEFAESLRAPHSGSAAKEGARSAYRVNL